MDILFFIIYLLIYVICAALSILLFYYISIFFPGRESYNRNEIVDIKGIIIREVDHLFSDSDKTKEYITLGLSSVIGLLLTYFGAIYGEHYESYFFHSALFPALIYIGLAYLKKSDIEKDLPDFLKGVLKYDFSILIGFSLATLAKIVIVYGIYHIVSFFWILANSALILFIIVNRMIEKINKEDYKLFFKRKVSDN